MTLINAEKFVERIQDCGTDETKQKVADALCFLVKTEATFHPVDAISVEWINKYANEHRAYIHAFAEMVVCWNERKEE